MITTQGEKVIFLFNNKIVLFMKTTRVKNNHKTFAFFKTEDIKHKKINLMLNFTALKQFNTFQLHFKISI